MVEQYTTRLWMGTHPAAEVLDIIQDRYMPSGSSKLYLAKNKAANPKLKLFKELVHKHYRFYNDGDSFTIVDLEHNHQRSMIGEKGDIYRFFLIR